MRVKHTAAAVAVGLGVSISGAGLVHAAPPVAPPPCPNCDVGQAPGIPALKCWPYGRAGGGNAVSGGGRPSYPPPCR